ncbi:collagen alpha-3(VI) chain-like [Mytilus trossulus]|uniref:collagen alpha-3(VI) chain-like n=1 Tax=Mytilus trossulus TaxID=6551 RepID=UPI003003DA40
MMLRTTVFLIMFGLLFTNCRGSYKDVIWLLDASSSISATDHALTMSFIYNVTSYLTIGDNDIRMAVVKFDDEANAEFELDDYANKASLLTGINYIAYSQSFVPSRKTMDALTYTKTLYLSIKGGRSDAGKIVIVIESGPSTNTPQTINKANDLRTSYGAEVFAIGIGSDLSKTNDELQGIANDPDSYYVEYIGGFINLCGIVPSIVPKIDNETTVTMVDGCDEWVEPTTTEITSTERMTEAPISQTNEGLDIGAVVGILLACLLILAILACVLYLLYKRKRRKDKKDQIRPEDDIVKAVNEYNDTSLGEKRHMYKRDTTSLSSKTTKAMDKNDTLSSVYENLGERSVTSSIIDVKIPI